MKLPNADKAVVDIVKIRDYCLSNTHLRGRHKARVFKSALGLTADDAEELRAVLLRAAEQEAATLTEHDEYGQRYVVDFTMKGPVGEVSIRSLWIVRVGENFARLTTCYVLQGEDKYE